MDQWKIEEEITTACGGQGVGFLEGVSFNRDLEDGKEFAR